MQKSSLTIRPLVKSVLRVGSKNLFFLFLNQNICCGYSKEPSVMSWFFWAPKTYVKTDG